MNDQVSFLSAVEQDLRGREAGVEGAYASRYQAARKLLARVEGHVGMNSRIPPEV